MSMPKDRAAFRRWWLADEQQELRLSCSEGWAFHVWQAARKRKSSHLIFGMMVGFILPFAVAGALASGAVVGCYVAEAECSFSTAGVLTVEADRESAE